MLERKLATILSADVAGYSRLMAEDEEQTLRIFRGHREVFESVVAMHRRAHFQHRRRRDLGGVPERG
jgi:class 3 adenylate cyclase